MPGTSRARRIAWMTDGYCISLYRRRPSARRRSTSRSTAPAGALARRSARLPVRQSPARTARHISRARIAAEMAAGVPFGRYTLVRRLARGGMAEIFLALQEGPEGFSRRLVIKRILPHLAADKAFLRMFL